MDTARVERGADGGAKHGLEAADAIHRALARCDVRCPDEALRLLQRLGEPTGSAPDVSFQRDATPSTARRDG